MSRSYLSTRGPKPPVAPKPRLHLDVEGENSLSVSVNGDSALSESEPEQESESEAIRNKTDETEHTIIVSEELDENADAGDHPGEELTLHNDACDSSEPGEGLGTDRADEEEVEEPVEETGDFAEEGGEERAKTAPESADTLSLGSAPDAETPLETRAAGCEDEENNYEICGAEDTAEAPEDSLLCGTYSEIQDDVVGGAAPLSLGDDDGDGDDNPDEPTERPGSEMEEPDGSDGTSCLSKPITEHDSQLCEWASSPNHRGGCLRPDLPESEASEEAEAGPSSQATNCLAPPTGEEYPYDVIGPLDENSEWQAERATKDHSGCYRFSDEAETEAEDVFDAYSVIEVVPADLVATADPELVETEDDCDSEMPDATREEETGDSNQEPYYVSSDDVAEAEKAQLEAEREQAQNNPNTTTEAADDYADIEDCEDGDDLQHLECVSSEDYVEIGDDDESDTERKSKGGKSIKERNAKRNSCQPRVRLCNITVPAGLDVGRTPELTNRVVFAHTTEAFEEDIEDLDCHIVPFFEDSDTDSDEHIYEEAGLDSEGENFISLDRKSIVTRSRSLSGKVPGYVPETVPEETGSEYQTHEYYTVALDQNGDPLKHAEVNRLIPSLKPRRFLLNPRSYSVEGRELPLTAHLEGENSPREDRLRRKDDNLSLPCVIASSGSFSQRSYHSSSGVSTPTSLVDIPPPFELAYITKRPVTKSSPSLLIQHESPDKPKKKKSSFKRFLALKFRRKTDSKPHGDGSVRSSRSSSESSHHGPSRVLELDRRSTSSSPQLQSRVVSQPRTPELPATFLLYRDGQKRKGVPKTFGDRRISRVESFEDRSRPPFMPLPLTKPRSISFPSADMSDYENIPAMSSDYENIQIPTGRPTRAVTITEFFDDRNRSAMPANDTDGYVDMNSFAGIETKPQTSEQETERYG